MKLKEQFWNRIDTLHYAEGTGETYWANVADFLRFYRKGEQWTEPKDLSGKDVEAYLTHLATNRKVSESKQNQAFAAFVFLYREVLKLPFEGVNAKRARKPMNLPQQRANDDDLHACRSRPGAYDSQPSGPIATTAAKCVVAARTAI